MEVIHKETIQECYKELVEKLKEKEIINGTKEINNCCLIVDKPSIENFWLPYRNISEKYANAELEWYWSGDNSCETIGQHASMWLKLTDDGKTNNSAYGYILEKKYGYDQIQQIIELLKKDKYSRRAILNISDPTLNKIETHDLQCTIAIQFLIRNGGLQETVYMRSNDIYFGLPYDYIYFISLGQYIASKLGIELICYTHHATSMHLYERDLDKFDEKEPKILTLNINKIIGDNYEI